MARPYAVQSTSTADITALTVDRLTDLGEHLTTIEIAHLLRALGGAGLGRRVRPPRRARRQRPPALGWSTPWRDHLLRLRRHPDPDPDVREQAFAVDMT